MIDQTPDSMCRVQSAPLVNVCVGRVEGADEMRGF